MRRFLAIILCIIMIFSLTSCGKPRVIGVGMWGVYHTNVKSYEIRREELEYAGYYMPSLGELSDYSEFRCSYQYTTVFLFESKTLALFLEYPTEIYEEKKAEAMSSVEFIEETELSSDGESYQSFPARFEYGGYDFRTAAEVELPLCKSFAFIGVNDDRCRIAYCYFYDFDLDTFGSIEIPEDEMVADFISDFFYWNDID